jgi:DNA-binding protein WhiA
MSFSALIKNEILESKPLRQRHKRAFAYGLFACSRGFAEIATESEGTAVLFERLLRELLGGGVHIQTLSRRRASREVRVVRLGDKIAAAKLESMFGHTGRVNFERLPTNDHAAAFLSGAFLACGNITDPRKSNHVEFAARNAALAGDIKALLEPLLPGARLAARRTLSVVYYKEYSQIEDLLTLIGAPKASLSMIEVEILKSVRNSANRATICESANIDKLVSAASGQLADIALVLRHAGEPGRLELDEALQAAALLRLDHPEASLRELSAMASPPVSRSGLHRRLAKLSLMAESLRNKLREENR